MAVPRVLHRLLRILELKEEQAQSVLESAIAESRRLHTALAATETCQREGRQLIASSVLRDSPEDRLAAIEQIRSAVDYRKKLFPMIDDAELDVAAAREDFLARRVERRQAETMLEAALAELKVDTARRSQASLDEWYLSRDRGRGSKHRPHPNNPSRSNQTEHEANK